jgi:hypothetical protein
LPAEGRKKFFDEGCSVTLTWKGLEIEFAKIQIALETLVLFCNKFTRMILVRRPRFQQDTHKTSPSWKLNAPSLDDNREIVAKSLATKVQLMGRACISFHLEKK